MAPQNNGWRADYFERRRGRGLRRGRLAREKLDALRRRKPSGNID